MAIDSEDVELVKLDGNVSRMQQTMDGWSLYRARNAHPNLEAELPYANRGYRSPIHAYHRLGRAINNVSLSFKPYLITWPGRLNMVAGGIATAEVRKPQPNYIRAEGAVELSYWFGISDPIAGRQVGNVVLADLLEEVKTEFEDVDVAWMVTLERDFTKPAALRSNGFEPITTAREYEIDDGVTAPRQLWVRDLQ